MIANSRWEKKKLSQIADVILGQSPPSSSYNKDGEGLPFFQGKAEFTGTSPEVRQYSTAATKIAYKDDILLSVRAPIGPTNIADRTCGIGRGLAAIRYPRNHKYLLYFFQYAQEHLDSLGTGTTFRAITGQKLRNLDVPFAPPSEQEKIVAKIEELFSEIDNFIAISPKAMALFARYKLSILAQAFTGKLTENEPFEVSQDIVVDDDLTKELPELPKAWYYVKLKGLGELARGKSKHRPRNDPRLFGGPYPFLQTGEVKASGGLITEYEKTYSDFGLAQSKLWPRGTLCITIAANIAETAFLDFDACFPDSVVGFAANRELVLPKYVKYFIELSKERIERFAPATAQKNINLKTLEELVIPLCSLQEQQKIIDVIESKFSETNNLADVILNADVQGQIVKQSILSKAFKGELV